jgi:hypothetical protein
MIIYFSAVRERKANLVQRHNHLDVGILFGGDPTNRYTAAAAGLN